MEYVSWRGERTLRRCAQGSTRCVQSVHHINHAFEIKQVCIEKDSSLKAVAEKLTKLIAEETPDPQICPPFTARSFQRLLWEWSLH